MNKSSNIVSEFKKASPKAIAHLKFQLSYGNTGLVVSYLVGLGNTDKY